MELPAGTFRVTVTRGIEYEVAVHEVSVTPETGATVRAAIGRVVDTAGWLACDLHLHAEPSPDSNVSLADRVASLLAEGVEFAAATDHNHVTDYAAAIEALGAHARLAAAPGVEITTVDPRWGHFNAFPLPPGDPPPFAGVTAASLFAHLRATAPGAVIQVNHPRMEPEIGYFALAGLDAASATLAREGASLDFDAVEVHNGMDLRHPDRLEANLREWFALLSAGRRPTATGSSDSHKLVFQWAGYPRTYLRVRDDRPEAVSAAEAADALRAGHAIVTTGPFLDARIGDAGPGDLGRAEGGVAHLEVAVRAAPWIDVRRVEVVVGGAQVAEAALSAPAGVVDRGRPRFDLPVERDTWAVVLARGDATLDEVLPWGEALPVAFTNPIWIDADGDGHHGPPPEPAASSPDAGPSQAAVAPPPREAAPARAARDGGVPSAAGRGGAPAGEAASSGGGTRR